MSKVKRMRHKAVTLGEDVKRMEKRLERYNAGDVVIKAAVGSQENADKIAYELIFKRGYLACLTDVLKGRL